VEHNVSRPAQNRTRFFVSGQTSAVGGQHRTPVIRVPKSGTSLVWSVLSAH